MKKLVVVVVSSMALVAVFAPTAGAAKPPKPKTAQALATVVSARGFDCSDYKPSSSTSTITITIGNLPKGDRGGCTIDGEHSNLSVYKTSDDLKAVLGALPTIGCAFAKGLGTPTLRFVVGTKWTISTPSSATGPKLAKALGAKAVTYDCK